RLLAEDVVDEVRLDPLPTVGDRRIRGRELDGRDRDTLADRDVADRRPGPVRRQQASALAREVDPGPPAEAEAGHPLLQPRLAEEPLRDRDRAHVRRAL